MMTASQMENNFPDYPKRDDMQRSIHIYMPSHVSSLAIHYRRTKSGVTTTPSGVPISPRYGDYTAVLIPDLMVCFDSDLDMMMRHNGYAIDAQGRPPAFALDIAHVCRISETKKGRAAITRRSEYCSIGGSTLPAASVTRWLWPATA